MIIKPISKPSTYISQTNLLEILLDGEKIENVFYPEIIKDLQNSTKWSRNLEFTLVLLFICLIFYPVVDSLNERQINRYILHFIVTSCLPLVAFFISRLRRTETENKNILKKSKNERLAKTVLDYFEKLRESDYPLSKHKAAGLIDIGKLHRADGGLLTLLGAPKDRIGIRKFNMGWGEIYFPKPELLEYSRPHSKTKSGINIQKTIMYINPVEDALTLVSEMKRIAFQQHKSTHVFWFEVLLLTVEADKNLSATERHTSIVNQLAKASINNRAISSCMKISQTLSYPDLEKHLPNYLRLAAENGNLSAKKILQELPEEQSHSS